MKRFFAMAGLAALLLLAAGSSYAATPVDADNAGLVKNGGMSSAPAPSSKGLIAPFAAPVAPQLPERSIGKADAPIKVDEYISLTCPHCGEFYLQILPVLEKKYVDTGKVRFVVHDYVRDATDLKAAVLARCMPEDEFFPFISTLYQNQSAWAMNQEPEKMLISYAKLGGLSEDRAEACLKDVKMQDAVVAERTAVENKIEATPTFIINDGVQILRGALPVDDFSKLFDQMLAAQKK